MQVAVHHQGRVGAPMQALSRAFDAGKIGDLRYMYGSGKGYYGGYGLMKYRHPHAQQHAPFRKTVPEYCCTPDDGRETDYADRCGAIAERHGDNRRRIYHGNAAV